MQTVYPACDTIQPLIRRLTNEVIHTLVRDMGSVCDRVVTNVGRGLAVVAWAKRKWHFGNSGSTAELGCRPQHPLERGGARQRELIANSDRRQSSSVVGDQN